MSSCVACKSIITAGQLLKCSTETCKCCYHYECLGMTRAVHAKIIKTKTQWKCPDVCARSEAGKRKDNSNTPVRNTGILPTEECSPTMEFSKERKDSDLSIKLQEESLNAIIEEKNKYLLEEIKKLMDDKLTQSNQHLLDKQDKLQQQYKTIIEAMNKYSEIYDATMVELQEMRKINTKVAYIENTNAKLVTKCDLLEARVDEFQNQAYSCDVEIRGVPEFGGENLTNITEQINTVIGNKSTENNIINIFRGKKLVKTGERPIIVTLKSHQIRNDFLAQAKKYNKHCKSSKLCVNDIGIATTKPKPIYISERTTMRTKYLLSLTREKAKNVGYKYVWTRNGKIYVRKEEGVPGKQILYESQLLTL